MEWISVEKKVPQSRWHVVFVTDGTCTCLARYIDSPKDWYGEDLMDYDEDTQEDIPLDKEWHEPHWLYIREVGPFIGNDECFAFNEITHWMNLPTPPKE